MNQYFTRSLSIFLVMIVAAISSCCGPAIITDSPAVIVTGTNSPYPSQTSIFKNIVITATHVALTPIPCNSSPKVPSIEIETTAEKWFQIPEPEIPNRKVYSLINEWENFCQIYKYDALNNESWMNSPLDIAVLAMTDFNNQVEFLPDKVIVVANPDNHSIVTVVVTKLNLLVKVAEWRVDLVREAGIWQIMWIGSRVKCNSALDAWSITGCQ